MIPTKPFKELSEVEVDRVAALRGKLVRLSGITGPKPTSGAIPTGAFVPARVETEPFGTGVPLHLRVRVRVEAPGDSNHRRVLSLRAEDLEGVEPID
jgi:hypothetical protein